MSADSVQTKQSLEALVGQVADEFLRRQQAGESPDIEEYAARHPEAADLVRKVLFSVKVLDLSHLPIVQETVELPALPVLGDFRLMRQVGRGGMGIVYEAEQVSLRRRVALKVLPFAATLDDRRLRRFQNEARAAAGLHHTNIVPVHYVGCEHGVYYYAMQFIEGQDLASTVAQLRAQPAKSPEPDSKPTVDQRDNVAPPGSPTADTGPLAGLSTERTARSREYIRTVVRLGIQAALALEYAHQMGVIHRDIKPANLLVDVRGNLWIADFGLAYCHGQSGITMTGDLVGTLRYMSPEQALAKRVPVDHRTDVYSLGATLYELLTLQPAFGGKDKQELLRQIAFEEPLPPRRLNKVIPVELETILLKTLEKNPNHRYGTAQELAEDLERHLKDEPIKARRPGLGLRLVKWARRHKPVVASAASIVAMLIVAAVIGAFWYAARVSQIAEERLRTNTQISAALAEAIDLQGRARVAGAEESVAWVKAREMAQRATTLAESNLAEPALVHQVLALRARLEEEEQDRRMLGRLEEARLAGFKLEDHYDVKRSCNLYADAFRRFGIDVETLTIEEASARIGQRAIKVDLVVALDDWAVITPEKRSRDRLSAIARAADGDNWRNKVREAYSQRDAPALRRLSELAKIEDLPAQSMHRLARTLAAMKQNEVAEALLRRAQRVYSGDSAINHDLGILLTIEGKLAESIRFLTAASALRPRNALPHADLGSALAELGRVDEAIAEQRRAIQLNKELPMAHYLLGRSLRIKGDLDGAIAEYREAIRLNRDYPWAHFDLAAALMIKGEFAGAIAEWREAIRLNKDNPTPHVRLGMALRLKGDLDAALGEFREAVRLGPDDPDAHSCLGHELFLRGRLDEAIAAFRESIRLKPDNADIHYRLALALHGAGQLERAIAAFREAIRLNKDRSEFHYNLGVTLNRKGDLDGAIAAYQEAIRIKYDDVQARSSLGTALAKKGQVDTAIAAFREAIRLDKDRSEPHYDLGVALSRKGDLDGAIAEYREAIRLQKDFFQAHVNLGGALERKGDVDPAIAEYREAISLNENDPMAHYSLGNALREKGQLAAAIAEYHEAIRRKKDYPEVHRDLGIALAQNKTIDAAIAEFREAIRLKPGFAQAYCDLGLTLWLRGELGAALEMLRRGHELGSKNPRWSNPSARRIRECERLIALDEKLPAILDNKSKPATAKEQIELGQLCALKQLHRASARFYEGAFAAEPSLVALHRYYAACAAALAGCGQGKDAASLNNRERERLRAQALHWLRDELAKALKQPANSRLAVERKFRLWQRDPDLAGVRDAALLAALPPDEQNAWRDLWTDVAKILEAPPPGN